MLWARSLWFFDSRQILVSWIIFNRRKFKKISLNSRKLTALTLFLCNSSSPASINLTLPIVSKIFLRQHLNFKSFHAVHWRCFVFYKFPIEFKAVKRFNNVDVQISCSLSTREWILQWPGEWIIELFDVSNSTTVFLGNDLSLAERSIVGFSLLDI